MSFALIAMFGFWSFVSVANCHQMSSAGDVTTTGCLDVCKCSMAAEQQTSPVYSVTCVTSSTCLPVDVIANAQSIRLTGTGIPVVGGWTCESAWTGLLMFELDLSSNNISDVLSWRHVAVSLRNLSVAGNNLRHVTETTFAGLVRLRNMDVSNNDVGGLDVGCFRHLIRLRTLSLIDNCIAHLQRGVFDGLLSLVELRLDGNRLTSLGDGVLAPLSQLTVLSASRNRLHVLDVQSFDGGPLTSLRQLDLAWNLLDDLVADVAPGLAVLRRLHSLTLDGNPTQQVRADGGRGGWSVRQLSVSHMPRLLAVDRGALSRFSQLTSLTMTDNRRLRHIDDDALPAANTLRMLYLHNNNLTSGIVYYNILLYDKRNASMRFVVYIICICIFCSESDISAMA